MQVNTGPYMDLMGVFEFLLVTSPVKAPNHPFDHWLPAVACAEIQLTGPVGHANTSQHKQKGANGWIANKGHIVIPIPMYNLGIMNSPMIK